MGNSKPFGFLFEEVVTPTSVETEEIEYDPIDGISYIRDFDGKRIPYVVYAWNVFGATNTGTATKQRADTEESDPSYIPLKTQTITETRETTDKD